MTDATLDRVIKAVIATCEAVGEDLTQLTQTEQTVLLIHGAQGVIDNGGFEYFFENDWPGPTPYSEFSAAYRRIGARVAAECLDRAVALFPFPDPHLHQDSRRRLMESLPGDHELFALGDAVCGDDSVWRSLAAFVDRHLREIRGAAEQP